jgi:ABC-type lipoprotein export system ATPase subunit
MTDGAGPTARGVRRTFEAELAPVRALRGVALFRCLHTDGRTILMATHNGWVEAGADRTVGMRDAKVDRGSPTAPVRAG